MLDGSWPWNELKIYDWACVRLCKCKRKAQAKRTFLDGSCDLTSKSGILHQIHPKASSQWGSSSKEADLSGWVVLVTWQPAAPYSPEISNFQFPPCAHALPDRGTLEHSRPTPRNQEADPQMELYSGPIRTARVGGWPVPPHTPQSLLTNPLSDEVTRVSLAPLLAEALLGGGCRWDHTDRQCVQSPRGFVRALCMHLCVLVKTENFILVQ